MMFALAPKSFSYAAFSGLFGDFFFEVLPSKSKFRKTMLTGAAL